MQIKECKFLNFNFLNISIFYNNLKLLTFTIIYLFLIFNFKNFLFLITNIRYFFKDLLTRFTICYFFIQFTFLILIIIVQVFIDFFFQN